MGWWILPAPKTWWIPEGAAARLAPAGSERALVGLDTFLAPRAFYEATPQGLVPLSSPGDAARPSAAARVVTYTSDRGIPIEMYLLGPPGGPTLLTAYGAGGLPYTPSLLPEAIPWLAWGGRVAVASIRSAAEPGDAWPNAGRCAAIEHAYDEVVAAARWLRAQGAPRVAVYGASHGGLVVAGALARRPEAFDAACCHVPLVDTLRHAALASG